MPYRYVEPDIFLSHNGVDVFYTYREGTDTRWTYWYTTDPEHADGGYGHGEGGVFDARYFTRVADPQNWGVWQDWWKARFKNEEEAIRSLIIAEIEAGRIPRIEGEAA